MFQWVDTSVAFRKWRRIRIGNLRRWGEANKDQEIFTSVQMYESPERAEGERFLMPLFFDLDSDVLDRAFEDAKKLVDWLLGHGLTPEDLALNFSGARGFHVVVSPWALGAKPSASAHEEVRVAAEWLGESLDLKTMDRGVYTIRRVLRVVGSKRDSGLRAVRLACDELLSWDTSSVISLAEEAGDGALEPDARVFPEKEGGVWWWEEAVSIASAWKSSRIERADTLIRRPKGVTDLPTCLLDLTENGIKKAGDRNKATLLLATFFKVTGVSRKEAEEFAVQWASKIPSQMTSKKGIALERNTRSVFRSVYGSPATYFSCAFARGLGLRCLYEGCSWIGRDEIGKLGEDNTVLSLEDAVKAEYVNRDIVIEGIVSVAAKQPKIIPTKVRFHCEGDERCEACPCPENGTMDVELSSPEMILDMIGMDSYPKRIAMFSRIAGFPRQCGNRKAEVMENKNVLQAAVQPPIGISESTEQHRENQIFVITHKLDLQNCYRFWGTTLPFPKTNDACHVIHTLKPLYAPYDRFEMSGEIYDTLSATFNGNPSEVFHDIHESFERAVHGIIGRRYHSIAMDIVLHTTLYFDLLGTRAQRGWGQGLAYGKSGHGKTAMLRGLFKWYDIGEIKSVEGMSYAGLAGGVDRVGPSFVVRLGYLCRHDRGWIGLDEWHKAGKDLTTQLARVDDDGVVEITKIVDAKSFARVRKWKLANCITKAGTWIEFDARVYGIEHALPIAGSYENLRRCDIVLGFGESDELLSAIAEGDHYIEEGATKYTKDKCRLLVHWVASRTPEDVVWEAGSESYLLRTANRLSKRYHSDLPVLIVSDARWKLARLAVGVAARRFSSPDGEKLLVEKKDIDFAAEVISALYDSDELSVDKYASAWRSRSACDITVLKEAYEDIVSFGKTWYEIFKILLDNPKRFTSRDLIDIAEPMDLRRDAEPISPKNWVSMLISVMKRHYLIERCGPYYAMTSKGIRLAKTCVAEFEAIERGEIDQGTIVSFDMFPEPIAPERRGEVDTDLEEIPF